MWIHVWWQLFLEYRSLPCLVLLPPSLTWHLASSLRYGDYLHGPCFVKSPATPSLFFLTRFPGYWPFFILWAFGFYLLLIPSGSIPLLSPPPTFFTYRLPVSISFLIPFILFPFLLLSPFRFLSIHFFPINSWPLKAIWESTDATLCNKGLHTCEAILSSCLKSIFILSVSHSLALVVNLPVSQQLSLSANGSTNQLDCGAT